MNQLKIGTFLIVLGNLLYLAFTFFTGNETSIEQKTGKKITWPKGAKVDGLPIMTMEDVDKKIDEWER